MNKTKMESDVRIILGLYAQGEFDRGLALARLLQQAVPQAAIANYCLGHGLAALQRPAEALTFLRKATQAEPRNAEFLVRYGRALLDVGKIREAETTLKRANDLNPRMPVGPYTLAVYYASINRFDAALPYFRKVLDAELPAEMRVGVSMDWATALIEVGQMDEASEVLREAVKHDRSRAAALASLSQIKAFPLGSEEYRLIEEELAKTGVRGLARSSLLMAKAASFASAGDYNREFDLILEAKVARGGTTPLAGLSMLVDDLTTVMTPEVLKGLQSRFGTSTFQPIYVVGLPRSGTTLTERILAAHSAVGGAGELQLVNDLARNVMGQHALASVAAAFSSLPAGRLQELLADIEATMRFLCPGVDRIVDKMPHNFVHCWLIRTVFPKARIVHCHRHPADNFMSGFKAQLSGKHAFFDRPEWFAEYHAVYDRLMAHWHAVMPDEIFDLCYEDLVSEPRRVIAELLGFCGLAWEEACLAPENSSSRIGTASMLQARSGINAKSVGGWKRYADRLHAIKQTS